MKNQKRSELPVSPCHRILKKAGNLRVSDEAAEKLAEVLEEIGTEIVKSALHYVMHSARVTLQEGDIEVAANKLKGRHRRQ